MRQNNCCGASLRFGMVGAGRIAQSYLQAFHRTPNARLTAVADVSLEAANGIAVHAGCAAFNSHVELADNAQVDAVIIATPPATHGPICLDFLTRGIPVLCEKPVSFSVETARAIQQASRDHRVLFTMASKFRYAQDVVLARNIVGSGLLGDIVLFENTFMSFVDMQGRWNADPTIGGGGVLIDNGTHSVDIMRYFIGPLDMIHAVEGPSIQGLAVEETVYVTARAAGGAVGRMNLSWSIDKQCDDYIAIYGSTGAMRVGWKACFYRHSKGSGWIPFGQGYSKVQAFSDQITNFSAAIQGVEQLLIDSDDAVASVDVIQAAYGSLAHDSWTAIAPHASVTTSAFAA